MESPYSIFILISFCLCSLSVRYSEEVGYGATCGLFTPCDAPLNCSAAKCTCPGEGNNIGIWDPSVQSCFYLALPNNGPVGCVINPEPNQVPCIPTANCLRVGGLSNACVCQDNLIPNAGGQCVWPLGYSPCSRKNDLCDPLKFLQCGQNLECECGEGRLFHKAEDSCSILPGAECSPTEGPSCYPPSTCQPDGSTHKCSCPLPSTPQGDLCVLQYNDNCHLTSLVQCDPASHLLCDKELQRCKCPGETSGKSTWDEVSQTCFLQPNTPCSLHDSFTFNPKKYALQCIPTSSCLSSGGNAVCTCRNGLQPNALNACRIIEFGATCNPENDLCDPLQYLHCGQEGVCSCKKGSVYDDGKGCKILPGGDCDPHRHKSSTQEPCLSPSTCVLSPEDSTYKCLCPPPSLPSREDPTLCVLKRLDKCSPISRPPNAVVQCDSYANMECSPEDSKCLCVGERDGISFWDSDSSRCFLYPGQPCNSSRLPCTPTASCSLSPADSSSYTCQCKASLEISLNGQCHLLNLGDNCSRSIDLCDPVQFLTCNLEGHCSCGDEGGVYDPIKKKCLILPNYPCLLKKSLHNNNTKVGVQQECVPSAYCDIQGIPSLCSCPYPSHPSSSDPSLCALDLYQTCSPSGTPVCDPGQFLKCSSVSYTCECDMDPADLNDPVYLDDPSKTCFLKAGSTCTKDKNSQRCTPNSACLQVGGKFICKCREGFIRNKFGKCYLPKGSPCLEENDLCDPAAFLQCNQDGFCGCDGSLTADGECLSSPGNPCNEDGGTQPCVPNAGCVDGQCQCLADLVPNKEGQCVRRHSQPCYTQGPGANDLCDPLGPLECVQPVVGSPSLLCLCLGELESRSYYSGSADTCFLRVGQECGTPTALPMPCIPNSICDPYNKVCVCSEPELVPNSNGFCYLPYGAICDSKRDRCDPASYLECNEVTGTCGCQREFETVYEEATGQCVLIQGRPCDRDGQDCDSNAVCASPTPGNHTYRCKCKENYYPNSESLCFLPHGGECSSDEQCDLWGHVQCGIDGTCECPPMSLWNGEECVVRVGGYCGRDFKSSIPPFKCVEGAECVGIQGICMCKDGNEPATDNSQCLPSYGSQCCPSNGDESCRCKDEDNLVCVEGKCVCKEGYYEYGLPEIDLRERTLCLPGFNLSCSSPPDFISPEVVCNPSTFLVCRDGVCQCPDPSSQTYLEAVRQCRVYVGRRCDNNTRLCVPRAICSQSGVCLCGDDYQPVNDLCFPKTSSAYSLNYQMFSFLSLSSIALLLL